MKNQLTKTTAPANKHQLIAKADAIATLLYLRFLWNQACQWNDSHLEEQTRALTASTCAYIEARTQEDELWTDLPDVKDLTDKSRIGDHLSATRRLMGITA